MGKNPRVLIVLALILALAALGTVLTHKILIGVGIALVGLLATVVVLRRTAGGGTSRHDDGFLEPADEMPRRTGTAEPLATWTPPAGATSATVDDLDDELEALESNWDDSSWSESAWDGGADGDDGGGLGQLDTLEPTTAFEPLVDLGPLDTGDGFGDMFGDGFGTGGADVIEVNFDTHTVNEDVSNADDIMAASQATELAGEPDNSELARLLAKVQARLAAYE